MEGITACKHESQEMLIQTCIPPPHPHPVSLHLFYFIFYCSLSLFSLGWNPQDFPLGSPQLACFFFFFQYRWLKPEFCWHTIVIPVLESSHICQNMLDAASTASCLYCHSELLSYLPTLWKMKEKSLDNLWNLKTCFSIVGIELLFLSVQKTLVFKAN